MSEGNFNIGDRVKYTNVFGYTHEYLIKEIFNPNNNTWYRIVTPTKNGKIPKRGGLILSAFPLEITKIN